MESDSDLAHVPKEELQPEVVPDSDLAHVPEDQLQPEVVPDSDLAHVPEDQLQPVVVPDSDLANVPKDELRPIVVPMHLDPKDGPCTLDRARNELDRIIASPYFSPEVDMVEIRADSIYHLTHKDVETLMGHNDARNIFTLRSVNEGGVKQWFNPDELQDWETYERARANFYQQALELGAHAIDIELSNLQREGAGEIWEPLYAKLREKGNVVDEDTDNKPHHILVPSVHNFDKTPGIRDLEKNIEDTTALLLGRQKIKYFVLKLAMMITCEDDKDRLVSIAELGDIKGPDMVVVGMAKTDETAEFAYATRKEFPYKHKTVWTYAALEKPNAPGQISLKEVREYQVEQGSAD